MGRIMAAPTTITMAQGPVSPWSTEEEAEEYADDPLAYLLEKTKNFRDHIKLFHNNIMVATYYLPAFQKLPDGRKFFRADQTLDEATFQGKVGLVLAKGPSAFRDDDRVKFHGQDVKLGEWVYYDVGAGRQCAINRVHCRRLKDVEIHGTTDNPEMIY